MSSNTKLSIRLYLTEWTMCRRQCLSIRLYVPKRTMCRRQCLSIRLHFQSGQCVKYTQPLCSTTSGYCEECTSYVLGICTHYVSYYACQTGYFQNGQCVQSLSVQQYNVCPTGTEPNSEGKCVGPTTNCPTGTTFTGVLCTSKPIPHGG